jgi:hypothetical protein
MWKQKIINRGYSIDFMDDSRDYEDYDSFVKSVTTELNQLELSNCSSIQVSYISNKNDQLAVITYKELNN